MNDATEKILYKELSYQLGGIFFKVHNDLGRFLSESQYSDEIEKYLKRGGIEYKREFEILEDIKGNRVDFLIENKIIADVKPKRIMTRDDYRQMLRYLKAERLKLDLIVNFRNTYLKPKRIVNPDLFA
jgi:GxxExxY protein